MADAAQGGDMEDWGELLDRLSQSITAEEEQQVREVAEDQNDPNHLVVLHRHVATLLVKHGISTWEQLRSSFPGYHTDGEASGQETSDPESPPDSEYEAPFAKGLLEARTGEELCSGGKRKAVSSPIGGKSKRQSLARGSKPTAPPKKPSPAAGGHGILPKVGRSKGVARHVVTPPKSKKTDTIPIQAGTGKHMRTALFNWRTELVLLEDGSTLKPQEFCTLVRCESPWRTTIFTEDCVGKKELGSWLLERCMMCREPGDPELLLLCDTPRCGTLCHTYCLTPKLAGIPKGDWFCAKCQAKRK